MSFALPQRVGVYELSGVLGRGAMGIVARARDAQGRDVAIKFVPWKLLHERQRVRFDREASALARIEEPGIVGYLAHGRHEGYAWLAMELVDGESLAERLQRQGAFPIEEALRVGKDVAQALAAVHAHGLIHRDVKPGNVFVDEGLCARLGDFGLVREVELEQSRLTQTGAFLGTPQYMSPEQAGGVAEEITPATDVFALGVVLYELLTGQLPFRGASFLELAVAVVDGVPQPMRELRPEIPAALERLVLSALAKRPGERPRAADLAAGLARLGSHEAPPSSRTLLVALVCLCALLAGGVFALTRGERRAPSPSPSLAASVPATPALDPAVLASAEREAAEAPDAATHRAALLRVEALLSQGLEGGDARLRLRRGAVRARVGLYEGAWDDLARVHSASQGELRDEALVRLLLLSDKRDTPVTPRRRALRATLKRHPLSSRWSALAEAWRRHALGVGNVGQALAAAGDDGPLYYLLLARTQTSRWERAVQSLEKGLKLDPHHPDLKGELLRLYMDRPPSRELTETTIREALAVDPHQANATEVRGAFNFGLWRYAEAVEAMRKVLYRTRGVDRRRQLAYAAWRAGDLPFARRLLSRKPSPDQHSDLALVRADARVHLGDRPRAVLDDLVQAYIEAPSARQRNPLLAHLTRAIHALDDRKLVARFRDRLDRELPGCALYHWLRLTLDAQAERRAHVDDLLGPGFDFAGRMSLYLAHVPPGSREFKTRSAEWVRRGRKERDPYPLMEVARILFQQGQPQRAAELARDACKLGPSYPMVWELSGLLARQRGDAKVALEHIEREQEVQPGSASAFCLVAHMYSAAGVPEQAANSSLFALAHDPRDLFVVEGHAATLWDARDIGGLGKFLEGRLGRGQTQSPGTVLYLKFALLSAKQATQAERVLSRFPPCVPCGPREVLLLAAVEALQGRRGDAERLLESLPAVLAPELEPVRSRVRKLVRRK